ncbi:MAG: glycosyltransferase [Bacteroidales bacterium]|nr:glycosyltransferase [Bacteroidales bacterium]
MKTKRKIAFFIPTLNIGGTEHSFVKLANAFVSMGERVQMVVSRREGVLFEELAPDVELIDLGNLRFSTSFFALRSYLQREKPTHLITGSNMHNEFVILANMMCRYKTKVILTQRNFLTVEVINIPLYGMVYTWLMRCFYPKAYRVVAVSKSIASFMKDFMPQLKVDQIYNPFDILKIQNMSGTSLGSLNSNLLGEDYILFVGRFVAIKNLDLLFEAFKLLAKSNPTLKLVLLGEGVMLSHYKQKVIELQLENRVVFEGSVSKPYPLMKNAKALILPSFSESLGGVLVEALALGTTIVSTPTQGAREVLCEGKYGYLSKNFTDATAFAELIRLALAKPYEVEYLKGRAKDFDSCKISEEYLEILD